MTDLSRYLDGQHVQVWTELYAVGPQIRAYPEIWADAEAVARETMARVKRNVERLREDLPRIGYRFARPDNVLAPPPANVRAEIEPVGPLPLAFRVFWETVGSVDLSGEHPDWPHQLLDPLMFEAHADYYIDTYEDQVEQGEHDPGEPFALDFAPDDLHKADISGGPPYSVNAPNPGADGIVMWEIHQTTFVNYLRTVMRVAGVGGLSQTKRHGHRVLPVPAEAFDIAADLEPF